MASYVVVDELFMTLGRKCDDALKETADTLNRLVQPHERAVWN
jgi:hypothetical protein